MNRPIEPTDVPTEIAKTFWLRDILFGYNVSFFALVLATWLLMLWIFWGCFADDAFIVARYAANLVRGQGLVYNAGEHVNALTSPLHVFILAPFQAFFGRAIEAYAAVSSLMVLFGYLYFAPRLCLEPKRRAWFLTLNLLFPPLAFWSIGGLETPFLLILMLGFLTAWCSADEHRDSTAALLIALSGIVFLVRYDASLLVAPAGAYILWRKRQSFAVWSGGIVAVLLVLGWLTFAFHYFGDILPTSFYQKNPSAVSIAGLGKGALYELSLLVLLSLPIALSYALGRERVASTSVAPAAPLWPLLLGLAFYLVYGLSAGIKHMMYLYRLFVPCVPWLTYLALRRATVLPRQHGVIMFAMVQLGVTLIVYYQSLNFNITVPFARPSADGNGVFEVQSIGARYNAMANEVFAEQAAAIRSHWLAQKRHDGVSPSAFAITGGQPPYELLDFHIYEGLSSYRKFCRYDLATLAYYRQFITYTDANGVDRVSPPAEPWKEITRTDLPISDWTGRRGAIRVAWYYQPQPTPGRLPARVSEPCLESGG